ncbi:hypothetical protein HMPREF0758_4011 [Serratia odorifera DSM 4582]|uniref:Uncharacterized protein n=1 Tax=Serratia odorifera DSM 4582 TaxID=667129 RepID=D4E761_SEROD|nr:hypothetical protein HMPREF0758_4011 [Serratia odorifera DSM 4582]
MCIFQPAILNGVPGANKTSLSRTTIKTHRYPQQSFTIYETGSKRHFCKVSYF